MESTKEYLLNISLRLIEEKYAPIIRQKTKEIYKQKLIAIAKANGHDIERLYHQCTSEAVTELINNGQMPNQSYV